MHFGYNSFLQVETLEYLTLTCTTTLLEEVKTIHSLMGHLVTKPDIKELEKILMKRRAIISDLRDAAHKDGTDLISWVLRKLDGFFPKSEIQLAIDALIEGVDETEQGRIQSKMFPALRKAIYQRLQIGEV